MGRGVPVVVVTIETRTRTLPLQPLGSEAPVDSSTAQERGVRRLFAVCDVTLRELTRLVASRGAPLPTAASTGTSGLPTEQQQQQQPTTAALTTRAVARISHEVEALRQLQALWRRCVACLMIRRA